MKLFLPLLLIVFTQSNANFFDNFFPQKNNITPIYHKKRIIGNIVQTSLTNNAVAYTLYSAQNKYIGSMIIHDTYISQEQDGNLTKKEYKQYSILVKKIRASHQLDTKKKNLTYEADSLEQINLHDGETLSDCMDFWIKKN